MQETKLDSRYERPEDLRKYAWLSIAAAIATILIKSTAALITGSVGLFSDAAESAVNLVAAIAALLALTIAIRPADDDHQFGHSKAEYFSAALEGIMIFVAAAFILYAAIERLIHPKMPEQLGIGLLISVVAALINGATSLVLYRTGKKHRSATLIGDAKHLFTDVITSIAVLAGVGLVLVFNQPILDPIVAILAGINILVMGVNIVRSAMSGLMDVALPQDVLDSIEQVLDEHRSDQIDFHAIRTREAGNLRFMEIHVLTPGDWTVKRGHDYVEELIDELVAVVPDMRVSAHLEPIEDPKSYEDEVTV
uniref:cation diffusion facilitator family transporter n=1 Tax=Vaginimicrobium propionicum TaxID=1871034 RepID=UPI00097139E5|nr:cation diffusion facilitator family transporter [Vaginimicrobium propionicum]